MYSTGLLKPFSSLLQLNRLKASYLKKVIRILGTIAFNFIDFHRIYIIELREQTKWLQVLLHIVCVPFSAKNNDQCIQASV